MASYILGLLHSGRLVYRASCILGLSHFGLLVCRVLRIPAGGHRWSAFGELVLTESAPGSCLARIFADAKVSRPLLEMPALEARAATEAEGLLLVILFRGQNEGIVCPQRTEG